MRIPLSHVGDPSAFAAALVAHRDALEAHRSGKPGIPAPISSHAAAHLIDSLIGRVPQSGPVATRGPDTFQVLPYEIVDDTPRPPEVDHALQVLRESMAP